MGNRATRGVFPLSPNCPNRSRSMTVRSFACSRPNDALAGPGPESCATRGLRAPWAVEGGGTLMVDRSGCVRWPSCAVDGYFIPLGSDWIVSQDRWLFRGKTNGVAGLLRSCPARRNASSRQNNCRSRETVFQAHRQVCRHHAGRATGRSRFGLGLRLADYRPEHDLAQTPIRVRH